MLRVTIELWPFGEERWKKHLGTAIVANDGTGTETKGNYDVRLLKWGDSGKVWKEGRVKGFPRLSRGPWDLLYLALKNIVEDRNE
jgi:hypothetical protein